jgi:hypothetical protein
VAGLAPSVEGLTPETQAAAQKQAITQNQTMGLRGQTTGGAMSELASEQARSAQGAQNAIGAQKNFVQSTFNENFETRKRVAQAAAQQEWENKHANEVAQYTKMMQMAQLDADKQEALLKATKGSAADQAYNRKLLEQANILEGASGQAGERFNQGLKFYNDAGGVSGSSKRTASDASTKASDLLAEGGSRISPVTPRRLRRRHPGLPNGGGTGLARSVKDVPPVGQGHGVRPGDPDRFKNSFYASGNLYAKSRSTESCPTAAVTACHQGQEAPPTDPRKVGAATKRPHVVSRRRRGTPEVAAARSTLGSGTGRCHRSRCSRRTSSPTRSRRGYRATGARSPASCSVD